MLSAVAELVSGAKTLGWDLHPWQRGDAAARPLVSVELNTRSLTAVQVNPVAAAHLKLHGRCCSRITSAACSGSSTTMQHIMQAHTSACSMQVINIEARCNAEIQQARAVRVRMYDAAHADEAAASPLFRGKLPPADKIKVRSSSSSPLACVHPDDCTRMLVAVLVRGNT